MRPPTPRTLLLVCVTVLVTGCGAAPATAVRLSPTVAPSASSVPTETAAASPATSPVATPSPTPTPSRTPAIAVVRRPIPVRTPAQPVVIRPPGPTLGGCPVFPADNPWNEDVSSLPVDPHSAQYIASINAGGSLLHPDFGSDPSYGIPYVVVPGSQPRVPITFTAYGSESDPGPYPVPLDAPVEAGSDAHVLVADSGDCHLYEMFGASRNTSGGWDCQSGAVFDLRSDTLRPDTWTSADAAGLPILPGLVRYDEVAAGVIRHALRVTVARTQNAFIHPATHQAGTADPTLPPMGLRLRLKASFDTSRFTGESRVILEALKRYGLLVADNGTSWYVTGATDPRWNDTDLDQLKSVPGTAFEAVTTGPLLYG